MATYAQFKHVELYKIGHGKNRVPNAPKSCIAEIFSADNTDTGRITNGTTRPRPVRDSPTRPRDTHSRLFGQSITMPVQPMVTDTIRSHIQFDDSPSNNTVKTNGSYNSSREGNPITGDYKSMNGQINTTTSVSPGHTCVRVPPGGYTTSLW